jgi:hypothetical protein
MSQSPWLAMMHPLVWSLAHAMLHESAEEAMSFVEQPPEWATHAQLEAVKEILETSWKVHESMGDYRDALVRFTELAKEHMPPFAWHVSGDPERWPEPEEDEGDEDDG